MVSASSAAVSGTSSREVYPASKGCSNTAGSTERRASAELVRCSERIVYSCPTRAVWPRARAISPWEGWATTVSSSSESANSTERTLSGTGRRSPA